MYYSDNKYLQCYSLIDDLAFQNMMLKQSFNQNVTYMESLLFNYTFNANSFLQMIIRLPGQNLKFKDQTEKSIIEAPLNAERFFKNSLHQVNKKNQQICEQLLILQKHLEKKAQKNKSLQKNLAKEQQLKQEITDLTDKSYELILKIQEFENRIKYDPQVLPSSRMKDFEIESINLLTTLKNDYAKQSGILQKCSQKIKLFKESLE